MEIRHQRIACLLENHRSCYKTLCESMTNHGVRSGSIGTTVLGVVWAGLTLGKLYDPRETSNLHGNTIRRASLDGFLIH